MTLRELKEKNSDTWSRIKKLPPNFSWMKVNIETYGCAKNQADSHIMKAQVDKSRHELSEFEEADVVIINTCIVKSITENRMRSRLEELRDSGKKIVVAGCMPEAMLKKVENLVPEASMINPFSVHKINELLDRVEEGRRELFLRQERESKPNLPKKSSNSKRRIISISEGCIGNCSFCITKKARKNLYSYPKEDILAEIKDCLTKGYREFYLSGEDTGCYGFDSGTSLPDLMNEISKIQGRFKVRVGMMSPDNALKNLESLVEAYKSDKFYSFIHLPVQSGSDLVLEDMGRNYTVNEFKQVVNKFRGEIPDVTLYTDIIAGFPTESDEDFQDSLDLLREIRPFLTNVSRYGSRPKTRAKREYKDLDSQTIKERSKKISKVARRISNEEKDKMKGKTREVLITEENSGGTRKARDSYYKLIKMNKGEPGEFKLAKVVESEDNYLNGELVD